MVITWYILHYTVKFINRPSLNAVWWRSLCPWSLLQHPLPNWSIRKEAVSSVRLIDFLRYGLRLYKICLSVRKILIILSTVFNNCRISPHLKLKHGNVPSSLIPFYSSVQIWVLHGHNINDSVITWLKFNILMFECDTDLFFIYAVWPQHTYFLLRIFFIAFTVICHIISLCWQSCKQPFFTWLNRFSCSFQCKPGQ